MTALEGSANYYARAIRINYNVSEIKMAATISAARDAQFMLREIFPTMTFVTSDSCSSLPPSQRFRIREQSTFWSEKCDGVAVVLGDTHEDPIALSDLMHLLHSGHIAPVGTP